MQIRLRWLRSVGASGRSGGSFERNGIPQLTPGFDVSQMTGIEEELLGDSEESAIGCDGTATS